MTDFTDRELRLLRYSLGYLSVSLDADLTVEAAQEMAPETQHSGEPLPDVPAAIASLTEKLRRLQGEKPVRR